MVTIEDLQWVDESSADFLRFLLSRVVSERLVVVATVRSDGLKARPRVRRLLSELGRLSWVERLDLEPFDLQEVAEYLALPGPHQVTAGVLMSTDQIPAVSVPTPDQEAARTGCRSSCCATVQPLIGRPRTPCGMTGRAG